MADTPEYEGYDDLVQLGRAITPDDRRQFTPPADLWAKIEAEVALDEDDRSAPVVVTLDDRRPRRRRVLVGAALVGAAAVALLTFAFARAGDDVRTIDEIALSNDGLDPSGAASTGSARLVVLDDGTRAIDLDVSNLPKVDGEFFELWLIDPQVKGMVSMGPVRGSGRFVIPAGVGTDAFPIVDLSTNPSTACPRIRARACSAACWPDPGNTARRPLFGQRAWTSIVPARTPKTNALGISTMLSGTTRNEATRLTHSSKNVRISRRASAAPRQKWVPKPKDR